MESIVYANQANITGDGSKVRPLNVAGGGGGTPGGANTDIQFNDSGSFGGDNNFFFDKVTGNFQWSPSPAGAQATLQSTGTGANIFMSTGDNGQIAFELSDAPGPGGCNIVLQNMENNAGGGGITIATDNTSGSGFGIVIQDSDSAGGDGIFIKSNNNSVAIESDAVAGAVSLFAGADGGFINIGTGGVGGITLIQGIPPNFMELDLCVLGDKLAFFSVASGNGVVQQTVTGSKGGNAALASLLTALAAYGLIVDSTT